MRHLRCAVVTAMAFVGGCAPSAPDSADMMSKSDMAGTDLTARDILRGLAANGAKMTDVIAKSSDQDDSDAPARPAIFSSRAVFYDVRHPKMPEGGDYQNAVEVFPSVASARLRQNHLENLARSYPSIARRSISRGPVVINFGSSMTSSEILEYQKILSKIVPE